MAAIRELFSSGIELERSAAITAVAHTAGFRRTGSKIADEIDSALIAAVKRGIIKNNRGVLSIDCRQIGQYPRDLLIKALLASMGFSWTERDEAIRAAARYLGFRRTGSAIRSAFKSAINSAIRRGLLEHEGDIIRRTR
jgi:hypothetical protein